MMSGHEQSDLGAVTEKPANKTRRRVAERVERSRGPRGDWANKTCAGL